MSVPEISFLKSKRGREILVFDNNLYHFKATYTNRLFYRCTKNYTNGCRANVSLFRGKEKKFHSAENNHNHEPECTKIKKMKEIKQRIAVLQKMTANNLCAVLKKKDDLCMEKRNIPDPTDNEVLINIHSVGICGSDVHYWKNGRIGDFIVNEPMVLGHESSGTVVKVGKNVTHLKKGDKVAIEPGVPCKRCEFCKSGRYNICPDVQFCATPPVDGSLCQYYCHDADFCFKLPNNVSLEEGALMEPLSVAVHACNRSGVGVGKSVLICGAGPIGLLNFLVCKAMGAPKVCITDISEDRLAFAKTLGSAGTVCVKNLEFDQLKEEIIKVLGGLPDITIECSGAESCTRLGMKVTKSGGVLMLVGMGAPEVKLPIIEATIREVDVRGIFRYANCYPTSIQLVSSGAINLKPLITHHFKLEDTIKAFETAHSGAGGAIKVLIHCT